MPERRGNLFVYQITIKLSKSELPYFGGKIEVVEFMQIFLVTSL